jgi:hypothetical protein
MTKTMLVCMLLCILIATSFTPATIAKTSPLKARFASVTVNGPGSLSMCDQGIWNANVTGASGSLTYEWLLTVPGNGTEPPVTYNVGSGTQFVTYLDYWISYPDRSSISLSVNVYNGSTYIGTGFTSVWAYPCPE